MAEVLLAKILRRRDELSGVVFRKVLAHSHACSVAASSLPGMFRGPEKYWEISPRNSSQRNTLPMRQELGFGALARPEAERAGLNAGMLAPLPLFASVDSKQLKVTCFYRFTQVFILKGLIAVICTKIVQVL